MSEVEFKRISDMTPEERKAEALALAYTKTGYVKVGSPRLVALTRFHVHGQYGSTEMFLSDVDACLALFKNEHLTIINKRADIWLWKIQVRRGKEFFIAQARTLPMALLRMYWKLQEGETPEQFEGG